MQKVSDIKKRILSVTGIGEVCRTLATVAAAKLSQTRDRALGARVYADTLRGMIARQQQAARRAGSDPSQLSPLLAPHPAVRRVLVVVFGPDRGLCGGYALALGRYLRARLRGWERAGVDVTLEVRGHRIARLIRQSCETPIAKETGWTRAGVTADEVDALLGRSTRAFLEDEADEVWAVYTSFLSVVTRVPVCVRLLPVAPEQNSAEAVADRRWFYEPAQEPCVDELLGAFVRTQIEAVLLEAFASEQAARMVTMQEASERADRSLAELRVAYNRARREAITSDLIGVLVAGRLREGGYDGGR